MEPTAIQLILRQSRLADGLTQDQLARRAHTSRTTLSAYEHGRKAPALDTPARRDRTRAGLRSTGPLSDLHDPSRPAVRRPGNAVAVG
ncbi:helix-turn-helix transcriptional regulator [Rhodococcus antarcticus]|uniref:helix-turn-helix transcriptional regulator n=1 Tax=Rhodococcus antarcticus TaxID=2987751 RepID=UPI00338EB78E